MASRTKKFTLSAFVDVSIDDLVDELNDNESLMLIKRIDKSREDWSWTEKLCVYFIREMNKAPKEDLPNLEHLLTLAKDKSYKV
jgi:hypothetical protein